MTPKNWSAFQHYKDRKPPWIKLHRVLLDDYAFACLPLASQALAPRLWLLASEYSGGKITASLAEIAYRLHCTIDALVEALKPLVDAEFFNDDSNLLAACKQSAMPERERETETETEETSSCSTSLSDSDWPEDFRERFWKQYPRRVGRKAAFAKLTIIKKSGEVSFVRLMAGVAKIPINDPRFIPHPTTWLNQGRWDDEVLPLNGAKNGTLSAGDRAREFARKLREIENSEGSGRPPDVFGSDGTSSETSRSIPQLEKFT